jgi:mono/diheme cytochrome c family protein
MSMDDRPFEPDEEVEASTKRWARTGILFLFLFALIFPVFRFYEPVRRSEAREQHAQFLADEGAELYEVNCSSCHGASGGGGIAPALGAREFLESTDDDSIFQLITVGVPGTEMVAYSSDKGGPMTRSQIHAMTAYLRSLEEEAESKPLWRTPLADEMLTGRDLYTLGCSRCHANDLSGIEDTAPALGPRSDAVEDSDSRLARRIREGKDEMPRFGSVLTDEQIDLIVAYLRDFQAAG